MKSLIIIPTYNESENIEPLVKQIFHLHPDIYILIVDDNSDDGTGEIADKLSHDYTNVDVIHRPEKLGLGSAYIQGFQFAISKGFDLIFQMDADFSHDPGYINDFLKASADADLVIGSRYIDGVRVEGWKFRRLLLSKLANIYVSRMLVRPIWDFTAGYRCYKKKVLENIDLANISSEGYAFQIEMTYLTFEHGFSVTEIPILFKEREHGYSKISRDIVKEAFWTTIRCRASIFQIIRHFSLFFKDFGTVVDNPSSYLHRK